MKGVILAGGNGTRLRPLTITTNKHLLPVFDKPMILYPLETLKKMGVTEILLVTGGEHIGGFAELLGDGSEHGVHITYRVQRDAGGIAQALSLAEDFVEDRFVVILGDNIFGGNVDVPKTSIGLVLKEVEDPARFGVWNPLTKRIVEKPKDPPSAKAVTGVYFYDKRVFDFIRTLKPSSRGELEITDVNNWYLENTYVSLVDYDGFWSDAGTFKSLLRSANYVANSQNVCS